MEIDAEIYLTGVCKKDQSFLEGKLCVIKSNKQDQSIAIRVEERNSFKKMEETLSLLFEKVSNYSEIIKRYDGILRIGVFYDLDESVVFPFRLSKAMTKKVAELDLSIDVTGYPCAEE